MFIYKARLRAVPGAVSAPNVCPNCGSNSALQLFESNEGVGFLGKPIGGMTYYLCCPFCDYGVQLPKGAHVDYLPLVPALPQIPARVRGETPSYVRCLRCGEPNWLQALLCARCGKQLRRSR